MSEFNSLPRTFRRRGKDSEDAYEVVTYTSLVRGEKSMNNVTLTLIIFGFSSLPYVVVSWLYTALTGGDSGTFWMALLCLVAARHGAKWWPDIIASSSPDSSISAIHSASFASFRV